jgi:tripartite-type tricarboxylate transporter receptor subunit TctC
MTPRLTEAAPRRRRLRAAIAAVPLAAPAPRQEWPSRPIGFIVSVPPGGSADLLSRALAPRVEARLRQPVVVENRPGVGGSIGVALVAKASPGGSNDRLRRDGRALGQPEPAAKHLL